MKPARAFGWLMALFLTACTETPPAVLRVGLIGVFEGTAAQSSGQPASQGARLAVREINAAGGVRINGVPHTLLLIEKSIAPRPDAAASAARALINLDSVDVIIGPQFSGLALAAGAVAEASSVPLIAPMASSPSVTTDRAFVTRLAFVDPMQGEVLARFAYDSLGLRRTAALFNVASGYGREIIRLYSRTFTALGGTFTDSATWNADEGHDQRAQIVQLLKGQPDAVLLPNFTTRDSLQARTLRALGFRGRILGSDSWEATGIGDRAPIVGVIIVANWDNRDRRPALDRFRSAWTATYPQDRPRATAAATYDAVHIIADAAAGAGVRTGAALATAIRAPRAYEGAFATYRFNGSGDPTRGAVLLEIQADTAVLRASVPADSLAPTRRR